MVSAYSWRAILLVRCYVFLPSHIYLYQRFYFKNKQNFCSISNSYTSAHFLGIRLFIVSKVSNRHHIPRVFVVDYYSCEVVNYVRFFAGKWTYFFFNHSFESLEYSESLLSSLLSHLNNSSCGEIYRRGIIICLFVCVLVWFYSPKHFHFNECSSLLFVFCLTLCIYPASHSPWCNSLVLEIF